MNKKHSIFTSHIFIYAVKYEVCLCVYQTYSRENKSDPQIAEIKE